MPFERPTLSDLVTRIRADFRSRLGIVGALVRRAMADIFAAVWAGVAHGMHGHLEWLSEQLFADTAERQYLLSIAAMYGITPTAATYAVGSVTATGVNGSLIPAGTILVRDDGFTYVTTADATIAGGVATVAVQASTAGEEGNLEEAETLTFQSPIIGVDAIVTADTGGIQGGFDEEDTEGVRERLILRLQQPPEGGAEHDYIAWSLAVPGVTRVWVYPNEDGLGTVTVRFVMDDEVDIFPSGGQVAAVQDALDEQRPITAEVTAEAPTPLTVNFTIEIEPNTTTVQDAIEAELTDLLLREGAPGDGAGLGTILLSKINTAVGVADGVEDYTVTVPAADVVPALGQLAVMGTITWV